MGEAHSRDTDVLTDLLDRVAGWPAPLVLAAAGLLLLAESGTLVGLFLPGASTLVALGLWSGAAHAPVALAAAVAAAGTVTGALTGFLRGRRPSSARWLRGRAERTARQARRWLAEHGRPGAWLLLPAGHWVSGVRTVLPRLAGAAGVPLRIAVPALSVSGTGWAVTVVVLSRELGRRVATHAQWVAAVVVAVVLLALALRRFLPHARTSP